MTPPEVRPHISQRRWTWWLLVTVLLLVTGARLRLLSFPLERDEGEYAYAGQLILQGIPPYELACNMKFPGTYLAYATIMILLGETPAGIHLGLLLMTTATALMLFWLGRKILDETAGMVAATSYALLAASPSMLGLAGHATHFCAFFSTAGLCFMWRARQGENYFLLAAGGILFGTAVLMKQHAAVIGAWAAFSFAFEKIFRAKNPFGQRIASVTVYAIALLLPFALCCLWLWRAGVFASFKFWTFDYAREYATAVPPATAWIFFRHNLAWAATSAILIWLLAAGGVFCVWRDARWENSRGWFLGFCAASALAVCPDFYFRPHYFLILLPALALLSGAAVSGLRQWWDENKKNSSLGDWPVWTYALVVAITIAAGAQVLFFMPALALARNLYGNDPLPESEIIAQFISQNSAPDARVAVLGSEPEIYFLAHRHSATGCIYAYALLEPQPFALEMQRKMIGEIEAASPEFIVTAGDTMSRSRHADASPDIFNWWENYQTNYTRVGLADIISPTETEYAFGKDAINRHGKAGRNALEIFQRKTGDPGP
jgi:4-amino-4-deoxy-L-arabinose transferase-like glycosyltransferase